MRIERRLAESAERSGEGRRKGRAGGWGAKVCSALTRGRRGRVLWRVGTPVQLAPLGLMSVDYRILVACREGRIYTIKNGEV